MRHLSGEVFRGTRDTRARSQPTVSGTANFDGRPVGSLKNQMSRLLMVRSVSDMAKAQDEQIPLRFAAMSDTPAIEVNR
jgi:hypothetical protein